MRDVWSTYWKVLTLFVLLTEPVSLEMRHVYDITSTEMRSNLWQTLSLIYVYIQVFPDNACNGRSLVWTFTAITPAMAALGAGH